MKLLRLTPIGGPEAGGGTGLGPRDTAPGWGLELLEAPP